MRIKLTDFREPNTVICLTSDTEIEIQGKCEIRFISLEYGCESVILSGDGKLQLHPNKKGNYKKWYPEYERVVNNGRVQYL